MPETVLIVDDEPDVVASLSAVVEYGGYSVISAADYDTAARLVEQELPEVVLLDINLAGRNGLDLLREIKNNPTTQHIAVIMVTALGLRDLMVEAVSSGAIDYIQKPWESGEVVQCITWAIRRSNVLV